jgi:hypothetical protein
MVCVEICVCMCMHEWLQYDCPEDVAAHTHLVRHIAKLVCCLCVYEQLGNCVGLHYFIATARDAAA